MRNKIKEKERCLVKKFFNSKKVLLGLFILLIISSCCLAYKNNHIGAFLGLLMGFELLNGMKLDEIEEKIKKLSDKK